MSTGIRRDTSRTLGLTLLMGVARSLLESVFGASKFMGVLDRMSMKRQSKLGTNQRAVRGTEIR
eukprot:1161183-Pelagomonas_calceolata.AAC.6